VPVHGGNGVNIEPEDPAEEGMHALKEAAGVLVGSQPFEVKAVGIELPRPRGDHGTGADVRLDGIDDPMQVFDKGPVEPVLSLVHVDHEDGSLSLEHNQRLRRP
jgi:hypothetical protein